MFIKDGENKHASRLIRAFDDLTKETYSQKPDGVWGSVAKVICGGVTMSSKELDIEFSVPFDDNMEANEATITIYNLSNDTINKFTHHTTCTIEAGYKDDTGVIFKGFVDRVTTTREGADKITTIKCFDDIAEHTIESVSYASGQTASYILKDLISKTGIPLAVFKARRDHTYDNSQTVDGDLMENIRKYAEVCGISVYVNKGEIYARYIKDGDNISFTVNEGTGMIGSPSPFEEEQQAEDFVETVKGYRVEMLLQHRITTAAIITLSSEFAKGNYRVRSGTHTFNESGAVTEVEVI